MRLNHTKYFKEDVCRAVEVILNSGLDVDKIYLFVSYAYEEPDETSYID